MNSASIIPRCLLFTTLGLGLGLGLAVGCGGESKPAATNPASEGSAKKEAAPAKEAKADDAAPTKEAKADDGAKTKVVEGKAPGDERYALLVEPPTDAAAGKEGEVIVRAVPKDPWHINLEFPASLKMETPAGVTLANASQKKADARAINDSTCEFGLKFTPDAAGEHTFTGKFKFAVCIDEACSPVTEDLSFKVAVK